MIRGVRNTKRLTSTERSTLELDKAAREYLSSQSRRGFSNKLDKLYDALTVWIQCRDKDQQ